MFIVLFGSCSNSLAGDEMVRVPYYQECSAEIESYIQSPALYKKDLRFEYKKTKLSFISYPKYSGVLEVTFLKNDDLLYKTVIANFNSIISNCMPQKTLNFKGNKVDYDLIKESIIRFNGDVDKQIKILVKDDETKILFFKSEP